MGLLDKAGEIVAGATGAMGGAMATPLPGVDLGKLREVVELVWNNREALVDLVTRLPEILGDAGASMHLAGTGAEQASSLLTGEVHALTTQAADTLDALSAPLGQVTDVLREMGNLLDRLPLVGNVASPVTRGLKAMIEVSDGIESVSVQIRSLGGKLGDVGAGLDVMGGSLRGGGAALATLSGRPIPGSGRAAPTRPPRPVAAPAGARPASKPEPATSAAKASSKGSAGADRTAPARKGTGTTGARRTTTSGSTSGARTTAKGRTAAPSKATGTTKAAKAAKASKAAKARRR